MAHGALVIQYRLLFASFGATHSAAYPAGTEKRNISCRTGYPCSVARGQDVPQRRALETGGRGKRDAGKGGGPGDGELGVAADRLLPGLAYVGPALQQA
jgi:hypothetical protein